MCVNTHEHICQEVSDATSSAENFALILMVATNGLKSHNEKSRRCTGHILGYAMVHSVSRIGERSVALKMFGNGAGKDFHEQPLLCHQG